MRIDAHQHFWRFTAAEYDWIADDATVLRRDFDPADILNTIEPLGIDATVAVQARQSLEETAALLQYAAQYDFIRGVVGWVPLADRAIGDVLDRLASDRKLKGVRHVVQGEPDPAFLEGAAFNAGIAALTERGLTYDLLVKAGQLPATIAFVDRHPAQKFVLDHIAKPVVAGAPPADWKRDLKRLAERPNVLCKFSGVVTEVPEYIWSGDLLEPYFDITLEAFGASRLMFGSDWPVCLLASSYARWLDFVAACAARLSTTERAALFGGNAIAFYELADAA